MSTSTRGLTTLAIVAASALLFSGCVNNAAPDSTSSTESESAISIDQAAAELLPDSIRSSGILRIGSDLNNPPSTFKTPEGDPAGWEVDLAQAVAAKLGLKADITNAAFDTILPSVFGATLDVGFSSYLDTKEREKKVDMVDYFMSGVRWATLKGNSVDPDDACGLRVAAQNNTFQSIIEIPGKSEACVAAGKPPIEMLTYSSAVDFRSAVALGRADAMTGGTAVTAYVVKQSEGELKYAGEAFSLNPLGLVVAKENPQLSEALIAALQSLIDDGNYLRILEDWGIEEGAIEKPGLNGALQ